MGSAPAGIRVPQWCCAKPAGQASTLGQAGTGIGSLAHRKTLHASRCPNLSADRRRVTT